MPRRIRVPFAISFLCLCGVASYLGFSQVKVPVNDKFLHFITFFILTVCIPPFQPMAVR